MMKRLAAVLIVTAAPAAARAQDAAPGRPWVGVGGFTGSGASRGPAKPVGSPLRPGDLGTAGNAEGPPVAGRASTDRPRSTKGAPMHPNDLGTPGNDER